MSIEQMQFAVDTVSNLGVAICILLFAAGFVYYFRREIKGAFNSISERNKALIASQAESNEQKRNMMAVIENCTAALTVVAHDRELSDQLQKNHDRTTKERICNMEDTLGRMFQKVDKIDTNVTVVKEITIGRNGNGIN